MTNEEIVAVAPVEVGDVVQVVTEDYTERKALVTCVHGQFGGAYTPCINVVYVSADAAKRDPYGAQVERMSSLQHRSAVSGMPRPGRFWEHI